MKEAKRDKVLNNLVKGGQGCPEGRKMINDYLITKMCKGFCSRDSFKTECWLELCDKWISVETVHEQQVKPTGNSLFMSKKPHAVSTIKVSENGIELGTAMIGETDK